MDRAEMIVRLALMDGFVNQDQAANILAEYRQAASNGVPMPPTEEWASVCGWIDPTMAGVISSQVGRSRFKCSCGWEGPGSSAIAGPGGNTLLCPGCRERELELVQAAPPHTQRYVAPPSGAVLTRSQALAGPLVPTLSDDELRLISKHSDDEVSLLPRDATRSSARGTTVGTGVGTGTGAGIGTGTGSGSTVVPPNVPPPIGRGTGGMRTSRAGTGMLNVDNLSPGTMVDDWRIERRVGEGAVGVVYHARDVQLERPVAIKVLNADLLTNPNQIERFRQEARVLAQLEHANILLIYRLGAIGVRPYIVMQWVEGESMAARIKRGMRSQGLNVELDLLIQAARGLHAAHDKRITHRDVKPDNLMITREGVVKVADFGLAQHADSRMHLSRAGSFIGTPAYAAPEQMDGLATSDQRVDVFALGITAFELITGQLPYQVNSIVDLAYHQKNTPLPSARKLNPDVSPELDRLLQEMCAKRPEDRPQTMGAVVERLEMLLEFTRSGVRRPTGGMQTRMIVKEEAGDHVVYVSNDDSDKEPELPDYPMAAPGFQPGFMPGSTDSGEFMQPGKQPHSPELDVQLPAAEAELIPVEKEDDEKSRLRAQLTSILLGPDAAARKAAPGRAPTPAEVAAAAAAAMAAGGAAGGGTGAAGAATTPKPATTAVGGAVDDSGRQKEVRLNLATTIHSRSRGPQFSLFSASSLFWMAVAALLIVASLMKSGVIPLPGGVTF